MVGDCHEGDNLERSQYRSAT